MCAGLEWGQKATLIGWEARQWMLAGVFATPNKTRVLTSEKKIRMNTELATRSFWSGLCWSVFIILIQFQGCPGWVDTMDCTMAHPKWSNAQCFQKAPGKPGPHRHHQCFGQSGVICNPEHRTTGNERLTITRPGFQAVIHPWDTGQRAGLFWEPFSWAFTQR